MAHLSVIPAICPFKLEGSLKKGSFEVFSDSITHPVGIVIAIICSES